MHTYICFVCMYVCVKQLLFADVGDGHQLQEVRTLLSLSCPSEDVATPGPTYLFYPEVFPFHLFAGIPWLFLSTSQPNNKSRVEKRRGENDPSKNKSYL